PPNSGAVNCVGKGAYASWLGSDWQEDVEQTAHYLSGASWDWLIVDHYAIDERWETALRGRVKRMMAIDDLANRRHDVDLLLDQNLGRVASEYRDLVPAHASSLLGPGYALVRPEFRELRDRSLQRRKN